MHQFSPWYLLFSPQRLIITEEGAVNRSHLHHLSCCILNYKVVALCNVTMACWDTCGDGKTSINIWSDVVPMEWCIKQGGGLKRVLSCTNTTRNTTPAWKTKDQTHEKKGTIWVLCFRFLLNEHESSPLNSQNIKILEFLYSVNITQP